jgi:cell division control protein 6
MFVFKNRAVLDIDFIPTEELLVHRDEEKDKLKMIFKNFGGSQQNIFCYGFAGTGKTCLVRHLASLPREDTQEKIIYLNLSQNNTELQALGEILYQLKTPMRSRFIGEYYRAFKEIMEKHNLKILLILDEVDKLLSKSGDNLLYCMSDSGISLILITNNVRCLDKMEDRTKSRIGHRVIMFNPYNQGQMADILMKRAEIAFTEEVLNIKNEHDFPKIKGIVNYIASISAQEHGDIRKAIALLKNCGELAEKKGTSLETEYVDMVIDRGESQIIKETIEKLPIQVQAVLFSLVQIIKDERVLEARANYIYQKYCEISQINNLKNVTERRFQDYLWELENSGITHSRILAKTEGKSKAVSLSVPHEIIDKILTDLDRFYEKK